MVPVQEIIDNDFDLSINKYKEIVYEKIEYPPTSEILADLKKLNAEIAEGLAKLEGCCDERFFSKRRMPYQVRRNRYLCEWVCLQAI